MSLFVPTESFLSYREKTRCRTEGELSLFCAPGTGDWERGVGGGKKKKKKGVMVKGSDEEKNKGQRTTGKMAWRGFLKRWRGG